MKRIYFKVKSRIREEEFMLVEVEKVEDKVAFGREIWIVKPVTGEGELSVNLSSLIIK